MLRNRLRGALVRRKGWDGLIGLFLALAVFVSSPLQALEPKVTFQVEYTEGSLTINAQNGPLSQLLNMIREKTGVEFRVGREQSERRLTVQYGFSLDNNFY